MGSRVFRASDGRLFFFCPDDGGAWLSGLETDRFPTEACADDGGRPAGIDGEHTDEEPVLTIQNLSGSGGPWCIRMALEDDGFGTRWVPAEGEDTSSIPATFMETILYALANGERSETRDLTDDDQHDLSGLVTWSLKVFPTSSLPQPGDPGRLGP
jgi:hypothetical protein